MLGPSGSDLLEHMAPISDWRPPDPWDDVYSAKQCPMCSGGMLESEEKASGICSKCYWTIHGED